ncbi:MAG: metallophosphoesterase [Eubacterium sp.]|nr:metallophosphoesterase [Eubacterium sp.]
MKMMRNLIVGSSVLAGAMLLESRRELRSLTVRNIKINNKENTKGKPVRLAFIADFHEALEGAMNERIAGNIRDSSPDLIIIGGDMLNGYRKSEELPSVDLIDRLYKIAPVIMAPGNHEKRAELKVYENNPLIYDRFMSGIEDKVHYLKNTSEVFSVNGRWLRIFGLDLPLEYFRRKERRELSVDAIRELIGEPEATDDVYNILIAHNPEYFESYAAWGAELSLSGHFHGGLVNIPKVGGMISPRLNIFPKYTKGLYRSEKDPDKLMYLTSGLGQHSLKIKVNNIPEIVVIDIC